MLSMVPAESSKLSSSTIKPSPLPQRHARLPPKPWPDGLLVRLAPEIDMNLTAASDHTSTLPLNNAAAPIAFETALFKGAAVVRVADIPSSSSQTDYFSGKKRKLKVCVQGVFKQRLRFDQVYSGQEFAQPLARVPAEPLVRWAFQALKARLPGNHLADLFGLLPYFLSPLILVLKIVRADPPGTLSEKGSKPPPIASLRFEEDLSFTTLSSLLMPLRKKRLQKKLLSETVLDDVGAHSPTRKHIVHVSTFLVHLQRWPTNGEPTTQEVPTVNTMFTFSFTDVAPRTGTHHH